MDLHWILTVAWTGHTASLTGVTTPEVGDTRADVLARLRARLADHGIPAHADIVFFALEPNHLNGA